jgi:hypothetical protein
MKDTRLGDRLNMRRQLKHQLLLALLVVPMVSFLLLFLIDYRIKSQVGHKDVLMIDIPSDIKCINEKFLYDGSDKPYYSYLLVLHGTTENLLSFIKMLGLQETDFKTYKGADYMDVEYFLDWWIPPSVSKNENFKFYQKTLYWPNTRGDLRERIQVELTQNTLYLASVGEMTILRRRLRERSWIFYIL